MKQSTDKTEATKMCLKTNQTERQQEGKPQTAGCMALSDPMLQHNNYNYNHLTASFPGQPG